MICSVCNNPIESLNYTVGDATVCHKCAAMYALADLYVIFANEKVDGGISRNMAFTANANVVTLDDINEPFIARVSSNVNNSESEPAPETPSYEGGTTE